MMIKGVGMRRSSYSQSSCSPNFPNTINSSIKKLANSLFSVIYGAYQLPRTRVSLVETTEMLRVGTVSPARIHRQVSLDSHTTLRFDFGVEAFSTISVQFQLSSTR
jgi:hypothetical protein